MYIPCSGRVKSCDAARRGHVIQPWLLEVAADRGCSEDRSDNCAVAELFFKKYGHFSTFLVLETFLIFS